MDKQSPTLNFDITNNNVIIILAVIEHDHRKNVHMLQSVQY